VILQLDEQRWKNGLKRRDDAAPIFTSLI